MVTVVMATVPGTGYGSGRYLFSYGRGPVNRILETRLGAVSTAYAVVTKP